VLRLGDEPRCPNGVRGVSEKLALRGDDALKDGDPLPVGVGKYLRHARQACMTRARLVPRAAVRRRGSSVARETPESLIG